MSSQKNKSRQQRLRRRIALAERKLAKKYYRQMTRYEMEMEGAKAVAARSGLEMLAGQIVRPSQSELEVVVESKEKEGFR